jgi:adenylate kinase family enzyme
MGAKTFVFFGIAGSGKGTQVKLLSDFLKAQGGDSVYAGTGEAFRKMMSADDFTSTIVREKVARGEYIDDFLTNAIFTNILTTSLTSEKHLFADGYPRTAPQAGEFEAMMKFFKRDEVAIVYIEVGKEESIRRNKLRARADDTDAGLESRYNEYMTKVIPAMNYFKDKPGYTIYTINGEQSIEDVHKELITKLAL